MIRTTLDTQDMRGTSASFRMQQRNIYRYDYFVFNENGFGLAFIVSSVTELVRVSDLSIMPLSYMLNTESLIVISSLVVQSYIL